MVWVWVVPDTNQGLYNIPKPSRQQSTILFSRCHTYRRISGTPAQQSFFGYDNDKNLKARFAMTLTAHMALTMGIPLVVLTDNVPCWDNLCTSRVSIVSQLRD